MSGLLRQIGVAIAYVAMIAMNVLANVLPLAGRSTGDISARFPIPFTPAGWVFSIWGLIYIGLAVFVVYQALPSSRADRRLDTVGWLFVLSCAFNVTWLVAWHNLLIGLTLPLMLGLLACLLAIYATLRDGVGLGLRGGESRDDATAEPEQRMPFALAVRTPFSLYLGWITVATIANVAIFLYDLGWQPGRDAAVIWSFLLVVVATAIGAWVVYRNRDAVYGAVLVWAFVGIAAKEWDAALLSTGAIVAAGLVALTALRVLVVNQVDVRSRIPG